MKILFVLLLTVSLTANAWLIWRKPSAPAGMVAVTAGKVSAEPRSNPGLLQARAAANLLAGCERAEPPRLRDALQRAGVDEATVRALIEGRLRRDHGAKTSAWQIERWRTAWWRSSSSPAGLSLRESVSEPLRQLLGHDPFDIADAESRYDFVSPATRRLLAMIDLDYGELQGGIPRGRANAQLKADTNAEELLNRERQKDVLAALTADERAEYELRFGGSAPMNLQRFATMDATESEFRAIKPAIDSLLQKRKELPSGPGHLAASRELQQQTINQLVADVGFDRAIDFLWATPSGPYQGTVKVLIDAGRPAHDAARLLQLAAETGEQAFEIHRDATLNAEQKRAALLNLQRAVEREFEVLAPASVRPWMPTDAVAWFSELGAGSYRRYEPMLPAEGWVSASRRSVTASLFANERPAPLARKPGAR